MTSTSIKSSPNRRHPFSKRSDQPPSRVGELLPSADSDDVFDVLESNALDCKLSRVPVRWMA